MPTKSQLTTIGITFALLIAINKVDALSSVKDLVID